MTDEQMLAEMRKQYEYATLESHILAGGVLFLRCGVCRKRPVPHNAHHVMWCDECLNECDDGNEDMAAFVARKRSEAAL